MRFSLLCSFSFPFSNIIILVIQLKGTQADYGEEWNDQFKIEDWRCQMLQMLALQSVCHRMHSTSVHRKLKHILKQSSEGFAEH